MVRVRGRRRKKNKRRLVLCFSDSQVCMYVCIYVGRVYGSGLTDSRKLRAHVDDHDGGHGQGEDMHEIGGRFEDDGVCELDAPCVTFCLKPRRACDGRFGTDERAEWEWTFGAYYVEVAEGHCCRG